MSIIFKWINIFLATWFFLIALGVLYVSIPYFGNQALIVRSGSMAPAIDTGSIVVIRLATPIITPQNNIIPLYNKNDIIVFRLHDVQRTIITHRVVDFEVRKTEVFYKTKGDANNDVDSWLVNERNVMGKTHFTLPLVGYLLTFAKSDLGFPVVIIMPAVFVILLEFFNVLKELRNVKKIRIAEIRAHLNHPARHKDNRHFARLKIFVPLLIVGLAIPVSFAFPTDTEKSINNVFTAAKDFSIPTSSVTPTPTPTPTPLPDTILTATPSGEVQISSSPAQ